MEPPYKTLKNISRAPDIQGICDVYFAAVEKGVRVGLIGLEGKDISTVISFAAFKRLLRETLGLLVEKHLHGERSVLTHLTREDHIARHKELHRALDELVADFIQHTGKLPSKTALLDLMTWSNEQQNDPTELDT